MPKYEWYFVNENDDVCTEARNLQNYVYNLYLRSLKPFNFIHGPKLFFKLMLISYLMYEILYS